jgi:TetR/AcrR family transcriptional repressor of nem operon
MARPREFDLEAVLGDAMEAFRRKGYSATSVSDLLDQTKLARGSLYGAFGDKRHLFLAALELYGQQDLEHAKAALETPSLARAALSDWIFSIARETAGEEGRQGCLMCKAAMEMSQDDDAVADKIRKITAGHEELIAAAIRRGQTQGQISPKVPPAAAAKFILTVLAGLRLRGSESPAEQDVIETAEMTLKILDAYL